MRILLSSGTIVTMNSKREILKNHDLLIEGDRVARIAPRGLLDKEKTDEVLNIRGTIVIPGLLSTHSHLTGLFLRGFRDETSFEAWLSRSSATEALVNFSPEEIYKIHSAACVEFLRHGVTTVLNMFSLRTDQGLETGLEKIKSASRAILDTGIRGVLALMLRDQSPDNERMAAQSPSVDSVMTLAR